jgi:nucleoside-diphosphate-sugar epimerase
MNILITGATGFTGSHLAVDLAQKGHTVHCLVRKESRFSHLSSTACQIIFGDLRDRYSVEKAAEGKDIIFNIAAIFRTWGLPDSVYYDTHVLGTKYLLEAAIRNKTKRYIHCSTIGVHGSIKNPPGNEDSPFNPGDIYQKTKLEAEQLVLQYHKEKKAPAVIIRPAGIYGPGDTRFLKLFKAIKKKRFLMIGSGETLWHPVYIDDLIAGFELAMTKPGIEGEAFILGGPEYVTLNRLAKTIADALSVPLPSFHIPAGPVQLAGTLCEALCRPFGLRPPLFRSRVDFFTKTRAFDIGKAKQKLGYSPRYDIMAGIKLTADWYIKNNLL